MPDIPTLAELRELSMHSPLLHQAFALFDAGELNARDLLLLIVKAQHQQNQKLFAELHKIVREQKIGGFICPCCNARVALHIVPPVSP